MTVTDEDFLAEGRKERASTLAGELRIRGPELLGLPRDSAHPTVLRVSRATSAIGKQFLNGLGVATFTLDSFCRRG